MRGPKFQTTLTFTNYREAPGIKRKPKIQNKHFEIKKHSTINPNEEVN